MADENSESRVARRRRERETKNKELEGSEGAGATASSVTPSKGASRFKDKKKGRPQDKRNVREKRRATGVIRLDGSILDDDEDEEVKINTEINKTMNDENEDSITDANRNSSSLHVDPDTTNSDVSMVTTPDNIEQTEDIRQETDKQSPRYTHVDSYHYEEERNIRHSYWRRHARYDEGEQDLPVKNNVDTPEIKITCDETTTKDTTNGEEMNSDVLDGKSNSDSADKVETSPSVGTDEQKETPPSVGTDDAQKDSKNEDIQDETISPRLRRSRRTRREELKYRSMPPGSLDSQEMHMFYVPPESPAENYKKDLVSADSEIERLREENDALISAVTRMSIDRR
ncbi:uncharacterized protein LOC144452855 isoform X2 [Glandiceps talaboti]